MLSCPSVINMFKGMNFWLYICSLESLASELSIPFHDMKRFGRKGFGEFFEVWCGWNAWKLITVPKTSCGSVIVNISMRNKALGVCWLLSQVEMDSLWWTTFRGLWKSFCRLYPDYLKLIEVMVKGGSHWDFWEDKLCMWYSSVKYPFHCSFLLVRG